MHIFSYKTRLVHKELNGIVMSQGNTYQKDKLLKDFSLRLQQAVERSIYKDLEQGKLSERIGVSRQALRK